MKSIFLPILFSILFCGVGYSQCQPNAAYLNETLGFYPLNGGDCAITFTSITDSLIEFEIVPGSPANFTVYHDAFKLVEVVDLPSGLTVETNVIFNADGNAPFGYWFNTGFVPNQSKIQGCVSVTGSSSVIASLANGGPNNDGVYPISLILDRRVASTNPNLSSIIQNGSWMSSVSASLGGGLDTLSVWYDVNSCAFTPPCIPPPTVLFVGLNSSYNIADGPVTLLGAPSGGTFYGEGIVGNQFDPAQAGVGTHGITYVHQDNDQCIGVYSLCTTVELTVGFGGSNELGMPDGWDVYPNPGNGRFNLAFIDAQGTVAIHVYDAQGREVLDDVFVAKGSGSKEIDLLGYADGAYTLIVRHTNGNFSKKLVKFRD